MILRPERFSVWKPAKTAAIQRLEHRGSAQSRGYDAKWARLSDAYRRKNPFCEECARWGDDAQLADLTDHIVPLRCNGPRLAWGNLQSLCTNCHARKALLETYAEEHGVIFKLMGWVRNAETRPRQFQRPV